MNTAAESKPKSAFFLPQLEQLMMGNQKYKISTRDDICRFAADCGIEGIDITFGMLPEPYKMLHRDDYRQEIVAHFAKLGTPIVRISTHTDGQLASLHSVYRLRFAKFGSPGESALSRDHVELAARKRIKDALCLGHLLGLKHHQTFHGGRGIPHHDQWSTLPAHWHDYELLFLAMQWTSTYQVAYDHGQQEMGVELGHVMGSLQTVADMIKFRSYLPEHLRPLAKWGVDTSHFDKEDDNACAFVDEAIVADLDSPGHAKDAWFNKNQPGARHRQNGLPFAQQAGKFEVFGMANPGSARKFAEVLWRAHRAGRFSYGVIEGEAMGDTLCPFQGLQIAAENLRRVIDGKEDLITQENVEAAAWTGPTFETFATSDVPPLVLLEANDDEAARFRQLCEQHGLPQPN